MPGRLLTRNELTSSTGRCRQLTQRVGRLRSVIQASQVGLQVVSIDGTVRRGRRLTQHGRIDAFIAESEIMLRCGCLRVGVGSAGPRFAHAARPIIVIVVTEGHGHVLQVVQILESGQAHARTSYGDLLAETAR